MRILSLAALAAVSVGATLIAGTASMSAQEADTTVVFPAKKVLGYQDPKTGTFKPLVKSEPETTLAPTTGTVEAILTITLKTALPKGGAIYCAADIFTTSLNELAGTDTTWDQSSYVEATVSGSTAVCTVTVPYSYLVPAASSTVTNMMTGTYTVEMIPAGATTSSLLTSLTGLTTLSSDLLAMKLPVTGTITKRYFNVTI